MEKGDKNAKKVGKSSIDALKEMAKVAKLALASKTSGKLINLSPVVASDVNIILDGIIDGTGSFGNLISPKIQMNFAKAFTNPDYRTEPLVVMSCEYESPEYFGLSNLWDYIAVTYPNAVLGGNVFESTEIDDIYTYGDKQIKYSKHNSYDVTQDYSASFSSQWDDFSIDEVINPNQYFQFFINDAEEEVVAP